MHKLLISITFNQHLNSFGSSCVVQSYPLQIHAKTGFTDPGGFADECSLFY